MGVDDQRDRVTQSIMRENDVGVVSDTPVLVISMLLRGWRWSDSMSGTCDNI